MYLGLKKQHEPCWYVMCKGLPAKQKGFSTCGRHRSKHGMCQKFSSAYKRGTNLYETLDSMASSAASEAGSTSDSGDQSQRGTENDGAQLDTDDQMDSDTFHADPFPVHSTDSSVLERDQEMQYKMTCSQGCKSRSKSTGYILEAVRLRAEFCMESRLQDLLKST